jgi:TonB family protein
MLASISRWVEWTPDTELAVPSHVVPMPRLLTVLLLLTCSCTKAVAPAAELRSEQEVSASGEKAASRKVYRVGGDVVAPIVVHRVEPNWPALPSTVRDGGLVIIEAVIDESGRPTEVRVLRGQPELAIPTVEAVKQWQFKPGMRQGKAVPVVFNLTARPHYR